MKRSAETTFYSFIASDSRDAVLRAWRTGNLQSGWLQPGADLAVSLGRLAIVKILLCAGAKVQQNWIDIAPETHKDALQKMLWELEAGVEPRALKVPLGRKGPRQIAD